MLIRENVDNEIQGRIWALVSLISQLGMVVAFGIAGFLADKIFNPLLQSHGGLGSTIGMLIGTGNGRGIGFIFILSGFCISATALIMGQLKMLHKLDNV